MSTGFRSKRKLQYLAGFDAAEQERQAQLARWSDNELLMMFEAEARRESERSPWRWLIAFVVLLGLVVIFADVA